MICLASRAPLVVEMAPPDDRFWCSACLKSNGGIVCLALKALLVVLPLFAPAHAWAGAGENYVKASTDQALVVPRWHHL